MPTLFLGQNVESIVKTICHCQPINFYPEIKNNKVFFTSLDNNNEYYPALYMNVYEKTGTKWFQELKFKIEDQSDFIDFVESENSIFIDKNEYFYSIYSKGNRGTAFNGRSAYMFIFQNLNNPTSTIVINFEIWAGDNNGDYTVKDQDNITPFKSFIKKSSEFVEKEFGSSNNDINSPENFHIKWKIENEDIYKSIDSENKEISFHPTEYSGKKLYDSYIITDNEFKNSRYFAYGGFASPIFVYDIVKKTSKVIFIPEAWPNGAGWGFRSFYVKSLNGDILTIESGNTNLVFNLMTNKFNVVIQK